MSALKNCGSNVKKGSINTYVCSIHIITSTAISKSGNIVIGLLSITTVVNCANGD